MRRRATLALLPVLGLLVGLAAAFIWPDQHGVGHACSAGAPASACFYPPDLLRQRVRSSLGGLLAGTFLAWLAWVFVEERRAR